MRPEQYSSLITAGWELAEESGLSRLNSKQLSQRTGISLLEIETVVPDQSAVLLLLISDILTKVTPSKNETLSDLDNLFDTIMLGFDMAQPHRKAIQKIWRDLVYKPLLLVEVIPPFQKKLSEVAEVILSQPTILETIIDKVGLQAILGKVFLTWIEDESLDLGKTMSDLDHSLKQYSQIKGYVTAIH